MAVSSCEEYDGQHITDVHRTGNFLPGGGSVLPGGGHVFSAGVMREHLPRFHQSSHLNYLTGNIRVTGGGKVHICNSLPDNVVGLITDNNLQSLKMKVHPHLLFTIRTSTCS
ncbi:hypothetical protein Bbelb_007770 [Branchiostoma belcheri]|nr:hypothetical protein Bbelb_007770 [Branchiostoma belcheri]